MFKRLLELIGVTSPSNQTGNKIRHIAAAEAATILKNDKVFLLDVRTPQEYHQGYIKGASLIPVNEIMQRMPELNGSKDSEIFVYCQSGMRSRVAATMLSKQGFNTINLKGGIAGWVAAGNPIEQGRSSKK